MLMNLYHSFINWLDHSGEKIALATVLLLIGWLIAKGVTHLFDRNLAPKMQRHSAMLLRRVIYFVAQGLSVLGALHAVGLNIGVLLGAAGIFSVAIGFASQTSASNFISGLFLIGERPFAVGDNIKIGDIEGEVLSIDLLSVKLRTYDNTLVRIPNESLIKSNVLNVSRFLTKRVEIPLKLMHGQNLDDIAQQLRALAREVPSVLANPVPQVVYKAITPQGVDVCLWAWCETGQVLEARNNLIVRLNTQAQQGDIQWGVVP
mgnify:CR=1 FL=1